LSELELWAIQPVLLIHPPGKTSKSIIYMTVRKLEATADTVNHSGDSIMMEIRKGNCNLYHGIIEELT
jgi:hypothetical protein